MNSHDYMLKEYAVASEILELPNELKYLNKIEDDERAVKRGMGKRKNELFALYSRNNKTIKNLLNVEYGKEIEESIKLSREILTTLKAVENKDDYVKKAIELLELNVNVFNYKYVYTKWYQVINIAYALKFCGQYLKYE
ncbi:hypothetical protein [Mycoplasma seminis]|uniref:Uncharacterized protein n=1 Tax=Mycoplasma seminis TaxID=512749 RepID=A0ABY9HAI2_9MOLU|nr:hypothetical protein [Mycoplasma seminis]WLP85261.1 hypothetical protein Q8852_02980 [Mycoplasma seminis]